MMTTDPGFSLKYGFTEILLEPNIPLLEFSWLLWGSKTEVQSCGPKNKFNISTIFGIPHRALPGSDRALDLYLTYSAVNSSEPRDRHAKM